MRWNSTLRLLLVRGTSLAAVDLVGLLGLASAAFGQAPPPPAQWLRLDPLQGEIRLTPRESFAGVPPRFVLMTDGSVFVGGRRDVLRGSLDKGEMQSISTRLDLALKSLGKAGPPQTLVVGEGPPIFLFSVLLGAPLQIVVMGNLGTTDVPALVPLPDFIRGLAGFRHPSLRPYDPERFAMIVKEQTLAGGCRTAKGLPSLVEAAGGEVVVPETMTRGFPTGPDMAQVCEGPKRYTVVFRPLTPGDK